MPGLREALEETYDALDADDGAVSGDGGEGEVGQGPADAAGEGHDANALADGAADADVPRARDESGKFVKEAGAASKGTKAPSATATGTQDGVASGAQAGAPPPGTAAPTAPPASVLKAPQSWKAAIREKWATLPSEVQQEVLRREKEVSQALQARSEAEKGAGAWGEVVRPYEAQIRAAGANPQQYVGTLLQTAHSLFYGPGHLKPGMLADLIVQTGVPPQELDNALAARLSGQAPQQRPQQPQEFRDPRLDQFFASQEAERAAEADEAANGFAASHEFFNDVAEDIAHQIDLWKAKGNKTITPDQMERFYEVACNLNTDVKEAFKQREAAASIATAQAATQRARNAASSVRSQPTAASPAQPSGRRAALDAAADELGIT